MSVFVKPLQTILKIRQTIHQYKRGVLVSGHFVIQGRQNRDSKRGCKTQKVDFKEEFLDRIEVLKCLH